MKYLLKLQRFDMDLKVLEKKLNCKILEQIKDRVVIETDSKNLHELPEVKEVIILKHNWKKYKDMKTFVEDCAKFIKEDYNIIVKFLEKSKVYSGQVKKKLNSYLKKEGLSYSPNAKKVYVEFKGKKDISYRLGLLEEKESNVLENNFNFVAILENPQTTREVSDFFRVCKSFEVPLIILGGREVNQVVESAKKITKGIDFSKFDLKVMKALPKIELVGFSKLARKNEVDLVKVMGKKKIGLVFGNEKFGLSQGLRDKLDLYRLGKSTTKPLLASQALTYVFGLYLAKDL